MEPALFRHYHEATKHTPERLRSRPHTLDWANAPDPFRRYEAVPLIPLPVKPPSLEIPALDVLRGCSGKVSSADGATLVSQILWHSAAISAARQARRTEERYFLRVNPSSGNLHPTEFHFATQGLAGWSDGLYHYRALTHEAEQRAAGEYAEALIGQAGAHAFGPVPLIFVLTSIVWREAWKYRERAYRYCLLDMGHAWQALALAARAAGVEAKAFGHFPDDAAAELLGLEDEWPLLVVCLCGTEIPVEERKAATPRAWFGGVPNAISRRVTPYPEIEAIHRATKLARDAGPIARAEPGQSGGGSVRLPQPAGSTIGFGRVARQRRSALDFLASGSMGMEELSALLDVAFRPFDADFEGDLAGGPSSRYIQLYVFAHAVRDLAPGLYRYWPESGELELLRSGDQRLWAAALSLGQDLAGNACVAFSMVGDLERAVRAHGERGYRYVHFEAGAIGQRLYLAAEALGLRGTGIGAFYDDAVHQYLGVRPSQGQAVYHFACGHAVPDEATVLLD